MLFRSREDEAAEGTRLLRELAQRSTELHIRWAEELGTGLEMHGTLNVWSGVDADAGQAAVVDEARHAGLAIEALDAAGIAQLEPSVRGATHGALAPGDGHVDSLRFTECLADGVRAHGGVIREGVEVIDIDRAGARIRLTTTVGAIEAEIERLAGDKRFVQVLLFAMAEIPLGKRQNWPVYEAAQRHGLPIGIHAGSSFRHPPSALGWGSFYIEDYVSQSPGFSGALNSLVTEGVFQKYRDLKVVLMETGVTWLPAHFWRINKTWRGVRSETPWLDRLPSEIIREHVRMTVQPFDAPPDPAQVKTILEEIGCDDMLLFSTDYPHWQFDGTDAMPEALSPALQRKIMIDNPRATYARLSETVA